MGPFSEWSNSPKQLAKSHWHCQEKVKLYLVGSMKKKKKAERDITTRGFWTCP